LNARSCELLDQRGLLARFLAEGTPVPRSHFAGLPLELSKLESRHPYALMIPQALVESLLEKYALETGVEIRRGHEVVGLEQDADGVLVRVRSGGEEYQLRCDYLVGCDGGSSAVRKLAGIGFPGSEPTLSGLLGDVDSVGLAVEYRTPLNYPGGIFGAAPIAPGVFRVTTIEYGVQPPDRDTPVTLDEMRAAIRRVTGKDVELGGEPRWLSRFNDSARIAERYREGRVLLAGDAAHIHFPQSGQGMNLGLADAVNLGWKLAAEVHGWAPEGLLDSYHRERHPVGSRVLMNTGAQKAMTFPVDWVPQLREFFGELMEIEEVHRRIMEEVAGVDARYPMPDAERPGEPDPLLGRRLPDLDLSTGAGGPGTVAAALHAGRGVLLDFSDGSALPAGVEGWLDRVDLVTAERPEQPQQAESKGQLRQSAGAAAAVLIRPDGHVAWIGAEADDLAGQRLSASLATWFGPARTGD